MARTLVIYCVRAITLASIWAACLKTYAVIKWGETSGCDLSDVLGITQVKQKFARETGIPTSKAGLERKVGKMVLNAIFGKKR